MHETRQTHLLILLKLSAEAIQQSKIDNA